MFRIFAVRGEMYSLFGYTVLNKLMIMKSYWLGQMFTNLKILDEHLEVKESRVRVRVRHKPRK